MKAYILHQYAQKVSYLLTKQLDLAEKNLKRREMNTHTYLVVSLQGEADSRYPFGTPTLSLAKDYTAAYTKCTIAKLCTMIINTVRIIGNIIDIQHT